MNGAAKAAPHKDFRRAKQQRRPPEMQAAATGGVTRRFEYALLSRLNWDLVAISGISSFRAKHGPRVAEIALPWLAFALVLLLPRAAGTSAPSRAQEERVRQQTYLGFDANDYPGDDALPGLRRTFTFSGYWLNVPPGAKTNSWAGKRAELLKNKFGFLALFNGRVSNELRPPADARDMGTHDAEAAAAAALREGFPADTRTVIYLDIEEGGRMLPAQMEYIDAWSRQVTSRSFRPGVYCSGMQVKEGDGRTITTADDIYDRERTTVIYFVYNDACPPSPGCAYLKNPPEPSQSGFAGARVWQFAQSPRRRNFTGRCSATYSSDGNCYPPGSNAAGHLLLDLDSSVSPDPSALVPNTAR
jgi:glycoside hydrolase-like protein